MSSATSTERSHEGIQPWQFFLLAGMLAATATVIVATGQSPASIIILSLTVVSASLVAIGVYRSLAPLVSAEAVHTPTFIGGRTRAALEREKTLALRTIKELEFDRAMGKISQSDYDEMSVRLRARALRLMQVLDADGGYREIIEKELATRLAGRPSTSGPGSRPANTCACGTVNDSDARFCKNCGSKLVA